LSVVVIWVVNFNFESFIISWKEVQCLNETYENVSWKIHEIYETFKVEIYKPVAFHVDCSYKLKSVQLSAVHTMRAYAHVHCNGTH